VSLAVIIVECVCASGAKHEFTFTDKGYEKDGAAIGCVEEA
jgi:hypothetical protein